MEETFSPPDCSPSRDHRNYDNESRIARVTFTLAKCVVKYRQLLIIIMFFLFATTLIISIINSPIPDFSDPTADFITVGTSWSAKVEQFKAMLHHTFNQPPPGTAGPLTFLAPHDPGKKDFWRSRENVTHSRLIKRQIPSYQSRRGLKFCFETGNVHRHPAPSTSQVNLWHVYADNGRVVVSMDRSPTVVLRNVEATNVTQNGKLHTMSDHFLNRPDALFSLCVLQKRIQSLRAYSKHCTKQLQNTWNRDIHSDQQECCPIWSLPNMVTAIQGKESCEELTEEDVNTAHQLISSCLPAFRSGQLSRSCWTGESSDPRTLCPLVEPIKCLSSPIIPLLLATVLPDSLAIPSNWRTTLFHLPLSRTSKDLFLDLNNAQSSGRLTANLSVSLSVHGSDLHVYDQLVSHFILTDITWLANGLVVLMFLLGLSTRSIVVPLLTLFAIFWSVIVAYAIYTRVLCIPDFPVLNLMAIVLSIGLGADDVLVYFHIWRGSKQVLPERLIPTSEFNIPLQPPICIAIPEYSVDWSEKPSNSGLCCLTSCFDVCRPKCCRGRCCCCTRKEATIYLTHRLLFTVSRAAPPMLLTTISTLIGLVVNILFSSNVAVQLFATYATLVILCHFVFVLFLTPLVLLLRRPDDFCDRFPWLRFHCTTRGLFPVKRIVNLIYRTRFHLILFWIVVTGFCCYQLFIVHCFQPAPKSSLSSSSLLHPSHPFETFVSGQANWFWAERTLMHYQYLIPIHFVWGLTPRDDRTAWTYSHKTQHVARYTPNGTTNLTSIKSREWLQSFCDYRIRQMPFLFRTRVLNHREKQVIPSFNLKQLNPMIQLPFWCPLGRFPDSLKEYIFNQQCTAASSDCCAEEEKSPIDIINSTAHRFSKCLLEYTSRNRPKDQWSGYRFTTNNDEKHSSPTGLIITVVTNLSFATETNRFITNSIGEISRWFELLLATAPAEIRAAQMIVPSLAPLEVSHSVFDSLYISIICAVLAAMLLIFLSSRSILLTVISLLILSSCIITSIVILSLLDHWTLGVVEGLVISLAAGLAIDPCIHVALSISSLSTERLFSILPSTSWNVASLISRVELLVLAVTGSSWSTAVAGLCMLPSSLYCYRQIGVFLSTLMFCSWLFGFVFFVSIIMCLISVRESRTDY